MSDNFGLPESKHKPLIKDLVEFNKDDLSFQNDSNINAELRLWECKWKVFLYEKLPDILQAALLLARKCQFQIFIAPFSSCLHFLWQHVSAKESIISLG